jgi:transposase-like protein
MSQKPARPPSSSERLVRDIRRATRKHYSAEEKIRIVLDGLRGEASVAELCRREVGRKDGTNGHSAHRLARRGDRPRRPRSLGVRSQRGY